MIGKTISHYRILEKLGEGGMGEVYLAEDTKLERNVALKFLHPYFSHDEDVIKRFEREAKAAAALNHPNIITIHEISEFEGQIFIAMEYVKGSSLREHIKAGPLPLPFVLDIIFQICSGLKIAHQAGITHRDIKPENILIDADNLVKIVDFGLAKLKGATKITKDTSTPGTVHYMSPEQVMGEDSDHRTDIWSLGVVLYEMLSGQLPFKGEFEQVVLAAIKTEQPKPLKELMLDIPDKLEYIVSKTLAKESHARYKHINKLINDINVLHSPQKTRLKITKNRLPAFVISGLFLIITTFIVVGYFLLIPDSLKKTSDPDTILQTRQKNSIAIMYFRNNTGDEKLDHWRIALSDLIITDLSQSRYVKVLSSDRLFQILSKIKQADAATYSSEVLQDVADQGNVEHILVGNYFRAGENFRIDVALQRMANTEIIGSERVEGIGEESMFMMVDELTRRIKNKFDLSAEMIASDIDANIGKITTNSVEALKYYSQGRKYIIVFNLQLAISYFKKALKIDPEFALAYRIMARAYGNLGYISKAKQCDQMAFELSSRVSERERLQIYGDYYRNIEMNYEKSIKEYKKLLQLYPDEIVGYANLGGVYGILEEWDMQLKYAKKAEKVEPENIHPYMGQAFDYQAKGVYDSAKIVLNCYKNNISANNPYIDLLIASTSISEGKYDLALIELEQVRSYAPKLFYNFLFKGYVLQMKDDLVNTKTEYHQLLHLKERVAHRLGRLNLGNLYIMCGNYKLSMDQYNAGIELADELLEQEWKAEFQLNLAYVNLKTGNYPFASKFIDLAWKNAIETNEKLLQIDILYMKGLYHLKTDSLDSAKSIADEMKKLIEIIGCKKKMRFCHDLNGMIAMKRQDFSKAIMNFQTAVSLLPYQRYIHHTFIYPKSYHVLFLDHLASGYYEAGIIQNAQETYERIISLTFGKLDFGDVVVRGYYNLGKIYEMNGWKVKAIEHYSKFVELWKECDPEFRPLVEDAKRRIELLNQ